MHAYVDESGILGTPDEANPLFCIALVQFDLNAPNEEARCDYEIHKLRRELQVDDSFEFRFSRNNPRVRTAFVKAIARYRFWYTALVMRKDQSKMADANIAGVNGYSFAFQSLFRISERTLVYPNIIVDEGWISSELATFLTKRLNQLLTRRPGRPFVASITARPSRSSNLLQLADYIAGLVRCCYGETKPKKQAECASYADLLEPRKGGVGGWNLPA